MKKCCFFLVVFLVLLCMPQVSHASMSRTWNFGDASNFTIEGSEYLLFSDESVKVIPNGLILDKQHTWYDTHFGSASAYTYIFGGEVDSSGNYYIAGSTASASDTDRYAFMVKFDSNFNEVWYKQFFAVKSTDTSTSGFDGIRFDSDGNLIATAFYYDDPVLKNAYIKIAKISPNDGSIIWQVDRDRGNNWIGTWDDGADGPILDSEGNIYVVHAIGANINGGAGPLEIVKLDGNGNIIWSITDDVLEGRVNPGDWPHYEDIWQIVVDSEDSLYISATVGSGLGETNGGLNYGLTKINSDGVAQWRKIKDMYDRWDAPRGLSIDSSDVIYQNGNSDGGVGMRKITKSGGLLVDNFIWTHTSVDGFKYAWNSSFNIFDQLLLTSKRSGHSDIASVMLNQDLDRIDSIIYNINEADGISWGYNTATKFNKYNSPVFFISYVGNSEHNNTRTPVIIQTAYTYPDQDAENRVIVKNKTGTSYDDLQSFRVFYGSMNQGLANYQISNNGQDWYYFSGLSWEKTDGDNTNTEIEVNEHISKFSDQFGPGEFYFRMFFDTGGTQQINISSVQIGYNGNVTALPVTGNNGLFGFFSKIVKKIINLF